MACRLLLIAVLLLGFANPYSRIGGLFAGVTKCLVVDIEPKGNDKAVTKVGKDVYQTPEQAEADAKRLCKNQRPKISSRATQETPGAIPDRVNDQDEKSRRCPLWVKS